MEKPQDRQSKVGSNAERVPPTLWDGGVGTNTPPKIFPRPDKARHETPSNFHTPVTTISSGTTSSQTQNHRLPRRIIITPRIYFSSDMSSESKKNLNIRHLPPECDNELKNLKEHVNKVASWRSISNTMKESIESLDSSKVETILRESFKILRITDRTRFITPNPVNLVPISNDVMISDHPDQNSITHSAIARLSAAQILDALVVSMYDFDCAVILADIKK
ncbi:hypothetical protein AJ78_07586 [Emergomyces pasteurianus Ep9510]|uniref:Uncharacterized protein n=1 Tax=Emergomyces pasteurianus Ep9510 TaxID=1447872 RepID=A0A1J9Q637_9EURO|nr:hypothetical protein AJ78_07586 [Emergomyces pasteurianus Ep9510]